MKLLKSVLKGGLFLATLVSTSAMPTPPSGKKWEKVNALSDEFNGSTIDSNKWFDYHPFWSGRPPSQFKQGNAFVEGGHLVLRSTSRVNNINQVGAPFEDIWIDAAAVVSKQQIAQPGWYYECEMKASDTAMSSSFWFRVGRFSEIDVIEHWGRATNQQVEERLSREFAANTHLYGPLNGPAPKGAKWEMPRRGRDGFERYGLWWKDANTLLFYYNGRQVMSITPRAPFTEKLRMIFDTEALAPRFVGLPTVASLQNNNRNAMRVNWVRTYKLVDAPVNTGLPSVGMKIALKDNNGRYVSSENGRFSMNSNRTAIGAWETFTVVDAGNGQIALRASNNLYVSGENAQSPMNANRSRIGAWERFRFRSEDEGKISIRDFQNRFISSENSVAPMTCNRSQALGWEKFSWSQR